MQTALFPAVTGLAAVSSSRLWCTVLHPAVLGAAYVAFGGFVAVLQPYRVPLLNATRGGALACLGLLAAARSVPALADTPAQTAIAAAGLGWSLGGAALALVNAVRERRWRRRFRAFAAAECTALAAAGHADAAAAPATGDASAPLLVVPQPATTNPLAAPATA